MPYVPNSMVMDQTGSKLYFGSQHELMIYTTLNNTLMKEETSVPGVVLTVSPNNAHVIVNDQAREVFYIYNTASGSLHNIRRIGNAAAYTPDSKTLYITDNAALGGDHKDLLYVYSTSTGWSQPYHPAPVRRPPFHLRRLLPNIGVIPQAANSSTYNPSVRRVTPRNNNCRPCCCPLGDTVSGQTDTMSAINPRAIH